MRYDPAHAGGWSCRAFIKAARAEGVPIAEERYAQIGDQGHMLHESPVFTTLDVSALGGCLGGRSAQLAPRRNGGLPVTQLLAGRLMTLPPFTRVPERFVRECARALRKVADGAAPAGGHGPT